VTVMMRGSALSGMAVAHKTALTGFLILALIHVCGVSAAMAIYHSGLTTSSIAEHYRGNEERTDVPIENLKSPKTPLEILTITHYHMAVMPIFTFLVCHILAMSSLIGVRSKVIFIVLAYLAIAIEVIVPWMALFAPQLVVLRHGSRALMLATTLLGAGLPLFEMWWPEKE
jgi:hypothetical protein